MQNKRLGIILVIFAIVLFVLILQFNSALNKESRKTGCFPTEECTKIESSLSIIHVFLGIITFLFALGFYIIVFYKGEEAIIKRLEEEKEAKLKESKFEIMLRMLDDNEKKIFKAIKEQPGIEQNTLTIRTNLSKSKVSEVLKNFESKNLIKRKKKGKTFSIFLLQ